MADANNSLAAKDGIIETASATTSPDNSNSGPAAYIITAVALVALVALVWGLSACTAVIVGAATSGYGGGRSYRTQGYDDLDFLDDYYDDMDDDMDIDDILERIYRHNDGSGRNY